MSINSVDAINALNHFSAESYNSIITVTIDQSSRKMNVIGDGFTDSFAVMTDSFINDASAKGLILTSGKETFVVGADIDQLANIKTAETIPKIT